MKIKNSVALLLVATSPFCAALAKRPATENGSFEHQAAGLAWQCVPQPKLPNVLLLGDSISIGYTLQVRELLKGKANVYRPLRRNGKPDNCFTVANGITNLTNWIGTQTWSVIHFNFGLHDLKYLDGSGKLDRVHGKQVTLINEYQENLEKLLPLLQKTGAKLIFATTTTVPTNELGRIAGDEVTFNAAAVAVMMKHGVAIDDLHALTATFPPELFKLPANVHYSDTGYARLAHQVAESILKMLP